MRRTIVMVALALVVLSGTAEADAISIHASPNPARVGERVTYTVGTFQYGLLQVWVSARGFDQPGLGTLPAGSWRLECCPAETAGTAAWHFRSRTLAAPGSYRFGMTARARGWFLSTARVATSSASVIIAVR
jgi:hypothetical protein